MREGTGILRLAVCYLICGLIICFSFFNKISDKNIKTAENREIAYFTADSLFGLNEQTVSSLPEKTQEEPKEQSTSTNSSVLASTEAVKGKIIERYISPYTAPSSYNNVYLKNNTGTKIDIKSLLNSSLNFKIKKNSEPQVLIIHTHATESFMKSEKGYYTQNDSSRSTNNKENLVKIGNLVFKKISESGIKVVHDTTKHDYPEYTGSYGRAAKTINSYLKKYPSIKIVLDLHRDAVTAGGSDKAKLVTTINGKKAAQVMLVMGSQTGSITNHPNWKENLKLALKLQQTIEVKYPTLARPLMLMSKKYNQNLSSGALLIEFGTDANTLEEASYSAELVGNALVDLLNTLQ